MSSTTDAAKLAGRERETYVTSLFNRIARSYDRVNRVMSGGGDLRWRRIALQEAGVQPGQHAVDLGTGTGDLYLLLQEQVGPTGSVIGIDLAQGMLDIARTKYEQKFGNTHCELRVGSAAETGLPDACADVVTMGWVLRNVGDRPAVYQEVQRILKPGGTVVCLDMSQPDVALLRWGEQIYLNVVLPNAIRWSGGDYAAYDYLAKSTAAFPRKAALAAEWQAAGFTDVRYRSFALGAIGLHVAKRVS